MKHFLLFLLLPLTLLAHMNIAVSYPYIGAITKAIGGDHVDTVVLAKGNWDPHFVVPRPSLIAKMRSADALIMNGGQLEIGWLPPLINRAANPKTQTNAKSFLNLSHNVVLLHKPQNVDRSGGDVHPDGNPHFHLNPANILVLAKRIEEFLISLDGEHRTIYEDNYAAFSAEWTKNMEVWKDTMADKRGKKVIQYHDNLAYFNDAYGLQSVGTIEPLPGIPPSSRHTLELIQLIEREKPCCVLHDVYHSTKTAEFISEKTGIKVILMPHDIGALESIEDLKSLFDYLTGAIK
ncbi:MAG: metal ABC transporter substrate-binding protein [Sulfurimonas sp.]|jgi:zinc/manganese transport system substrate-binding protein|nr:metal ABC transporter substrate-binding protein [Sulfurimonas sp.]